MRVRWFPFTEWEKLRAIAFFVLWLFVWDDRIDMAEKGFHNDLEEAWTNFQSTLKFIHWSLGLDNSEDSEPDEKVGNSIACSAATRNLFGRFAAPFRKGVARGKLEV